MLTDVVEKRVHRGLTVLCETKRNEMERNEMERNEMKICSLRNEIISTILSGPDI